MINNLPLPMFEKELLKKDPESYMNDTEPCKIDTYKLTKAAMEMKLKIYKQVFADMPTELAKKLLIKTSEQMDSTVYGEIKFSSLAHILQVCDPQENTIFVDLGHGTGKAMVTASLLFGDRFKEIRGIENGTLLHEESIKRIEIYQNIISSSNLSLYVNNSHQVLFPQEGDFLTPYDKNSYDWTQAGKLTLSIHF